MTDTVPSDGAEGGDSDVDDRSAVVDGDGVEEDESGESQNKRPSVSPSSSPGAGGRGRGRPRKTKGKAGRRMFVRGKMGKFGKHREVDNGRLAKRLIQELRDRQLIPMPLMAERPEHDVVASGYAAFQGHPHREIFGRHFQSISDFEPF